MSSNIGIISGALVLTFSKISIAILFSVILLLPLVAIGVQQELQPEQVGKDSELTEIQVRTLAEARDSGISIGWENQIQSTGLGNEYGESIAVDSIGNAYVSGTFCYDLTLGAISLENIGICDIFLAKMAPNGYWYWAIQMGGGDSRTVSQFHTVSIANNGDIFVGGYSNASSLILGSITEYNSHPGTSQIVIAKSSSNGEWLWGQMIGGEQLDYSKSVHTTPDGGIIVAGGFNSTSINFGTHSIFNENESQFDAFIAKSDSDGNWIWAKSVGGSELDEIKDMYVDGDGIITVIGNYDGLIEFGDYTLQSTADDNVFISTLYSTNGTWRGATSLGADSVMIYGITGFSQGEIAVTGTFAGSMEIGATTLESVDESQDIFVSRLDSEGNWTWAVSAGGADVDTAFDISSGAFGRSVIVGHYMSSSISFGGDVLTNADLWDSDWDMYVAWLDSAGNWEGVVGASGSDMDKLKAVDIHSNGMVYTVGRTNSTSLEIGLDERSMSGGADMFVALLDVDSDGDEIGDDRDRFPNDSTQQSDRDNDGYGDNYWGLNGDSFPDDSTQHTDSDGDGYGDNKYGNNPDKCPNDYTQSLDNDGDGYCDSSWGNNPDIFPNDSTQWRDSDNDGYGDNPSGNSADKFPYDSTQHSDSDGDGYGDSSTGDNPDGFRYEPTQWRDVDDDGYGDNSSGVDGDLCLGTSSEEKRSVDENGCGESQRDTDDDGVNDAKDICDNTQDTITTNLVGCSAYQRDFDGDGFVDALDPCPDSVENMCLEATIGVGEKESSTEARLLWGSFGLLVFIAILVLIMTFRKGKEGNTTPIIIGNMPEWK